MFRRTPISSRSQSGFTLIELMVTLAIVAILGALAAPSLRTFFVRNAFSNIGNEFNGSVLRARNEAISKNMCVTMCRSTTVDNSAPTCDATSSVSAANWQSGWLVFMNPECNATINEPQEKNSAGVLTSKPENMLLARRPGDSNYTLNVVTAGSATIPAPVSTAPVVKIQFNSRGQTDLPIAGATLQLGYSPNLALSNSYTFNVCVDRLGRTRSIAANLAC